MNTTYSTKQPISLSETLNLVPIQAQNGEELRVLMGRVYPPVYSYLWEDNGKAYLDSLYNDSVLKQEVEDPKSRYFFVEVEREKVGILKLLVDVPLGGYEDYHCVRLERLYLDSSTRGKGIGKQLLNWSATYYKKSAKSLVWLESMKKKVAAPDFYLSQGFQIHSEKTLELEGIIEGYREMLVFYKKLSGCEPIQS